jgi:shikimate kinase
MKITVIGYMAAGKSTIGEILAKKYNLPFIDLDKAIEKHTGYTITETIFNKGELYFRKLERQILEEVIQSEKFVLSSGGGTPCYYDNMELINRNSISIFLQNTVQNLYERLENSKAGRPLIAHLDGDALKEYVGKHLFERNVFYEKATLVINTANKMPDQITNEIMNVLDE